MPMSKRKVAFVLEVAGLLPSLAQKFRQNCLIQNKVYDSIPKNKMMVGVSEAWGSPSLFPFSIWPWIGLSLTGAEVGQ